MTFNRLQVFVDRRSRFLSSGEHQVAIAMNDFDYWFDNIVSQASLIASPRSLRRAWVHREKNITSAYDVDELLEQLLGDLHLAERLCDFSDELRRLNAFEAIAAFSSSVLSLEKAVKDDLAYQDAENLLASSQWEEVVKSAKWVVDSSFGRT